MLIPRGAHRCHSQPPPTPMPPLWGNHQGAMGQSLRPSWPSYLISWPAAHLFIFNSDRSDSSLSKPTNPLGCGLPPETTPASAPLPPPVLRWPPLACCRSCLSSCLSRPPGVAVAFSKNERTKGDIGLNHASLALTLPDLQPEPIRAQHRIKLRPVDLSTHSVQTAPPGSEPPS